MSRPYRYPDFFDPIFDAVPPPPDPERDFRQWLTDQEPEMVTAVCPGAPYGIKTLMRFTAKGAPLMQSSAATPHEAEDLFLQKARAYWENNERK